MSWFRRQRAVRPPPGPPQDPGWARTEKGGFHRLEDLDPEDLGLMGQGGVFIIWHGGVRPAFVYAGAATDLARALHDIAANPDLRAHEIRGGLFVTWSLTHAPYRAGAVAYLQDLLMPVMVNPAAAGAEPVPVLPPAGT